MLAGCACVDRQCDAAAAARPWASIKHVAETPNRLISWFTPELAQRACSFDSKKYTENDQPCIEQSLKKIICGYAYNVRVYFSLQQRFLSGISQSAVMHLFIYHRIRRHWSGLVQRLKSNAVHLSSCDGNTSSLEHTIFGKVQHGTHIYQSSRSHVSKLGMRVGCLCTESCQRLRLTTDHSFIQKVAVSSINIIWLFSDREKINGPPRIKK